MQALTAEQKVQRAVIALIREQPFYATALLKMKISADPSFPTAATDGKDLVYNPEFIDGLTRDAVITLLIHEVEHILFGHHIRRGEERDHTGWNIAADLAINSHLTHRAGFQELDGCYPGGKHFEQMPHGETAERYYDLLKRKDPPPNPTKPRDGGKGEGGSGQSQDGDDQKGAQEPAGDQKGDGTSTGKGKGEIGAQAGSGEAGEGGYEGEDMVVGEVLPSKVPEQQAEAERQQLVIQCSNACPPGMIPAHLKSLVDDVSKPVKVPWHIILRRFCEKAARSRLTYNKINRRLNDWPDRIPARGGKKIGELCVVLDTSGSHWSEAPKILDHIEAIAKAYPGTSIRLIQFDTEAVERVYSSSELPIPRKRWEIEGGGGTRLTPAWEKAQKSNAAAIIVYTDGWLDDWPKTASRCPVIWLMSTDVQVPVKGLVVRVGED